MNSSSNSWRFPDLSAAPGKVWLSFLRQRLGRSRRELAELEGDSIAPAGRSADTKSTLRESRSDRTFLFAAGQPTTLSHPVVSITRAATASNVGIEIIALVGTSAPPRPNPA